MKSKYVSIEYPLAIHKPKRRLCEIIVKVRKDNIHKVIEHLRRIDTPILITPLDNDLVLLNTFIPESYVKTSNTHEKLTLIPGVEECIVKSSAITNMGIGLSSIIFPLIFLGRRGVVFSAPRFAKAIHMTRELFKTSADVVLYRLGYYYGKTVVEDFLKMYNLEKISLMTLMKKPRLLKDLIDYFTNIARVAGWIKLEVESYSLVGLKAVFKGYDSWEAKFYLEYYGKSNRPVCHLTRGTIAGVASTVLGVELLCIEEKCIAKGDEYCSFLIKKR